VSAAFLKLPVSTTLANARIASKRSMAASKGGRIVWIA